MGAKPYIPGTVVSVARFGEKQFSGVVCGWELNHIVSVASFWQESFQETCVGRSLVTVFRWLALGRRQFFGRRVGGSLVAVFRWLVLSRMRILCDTVVYPFKDYLRTGNFGGLISVLGLIPLQ